MSSDQLALVKVTGYHCKKPPTPFMTVGFPLFLPKCPPPGNFLNYINSMEKKKTNKIIIIIWSIFFYLFFFLSPLSHFVLTPPPTHLFLFMTLQFIVILFPVGVILFVFIFLFQYFCFHFFCIFFLLFLWNLSDYTLIYNIYIYITKKIINGVEPLHCNILVRST